MTQILKPIFFISTLILLSCSQEQAQEKNIKKNNSEVQTSTITKNVNVDEFKQLIEKEEGVIVDVRTPQEYLRGNIKNSKNINISDNFSEEIQKLDKNEPIYVYCAVGGRSSRAMQMMQQMGFKEVYNLMGGYNAWSRQ